MPRKSFFWLGLAAWIAGLASFVRAAESVEADRVIVLANANDPESVRLAHYYAERRSVPAENLIALPMSADETITWRVFVDTIYQPLQDELVKRKWIDAIGTSLTDSVGRKKYAISGHRIGYLVTCRGVPLKIDHDPALYEEALPYTQRSEFRTNCGAVDAELSLLASSGYRINAFVPNPLFHKDRPTTFDAAKVVKVSRLDGPSYAAAAGLVDQAITAEETGLIGRAYVDIGGPVPEGDTWLTHTAEELEQADFDTSVDREPATFAPAARFDAPALYFGWYTWDLNGPFAQPEFHFPPGAIALHIHSFSARTLRSARAGWCGPLLDRGVTATLGNVFEPYFLLLHEPHLFLHALLRGDTLADAAYYALPALSWQEVVIGDPLYRPFKVSLADQWEKRASLTGDQYPYVVLRELQRLMRAGQEGRAIQAAQESLRERPNLVVALKLARLLKNSGELEQARETLTTATSRDLQSVKPALIPVAREAAVFLVENGAPDKGLDVFRTLLGIETLSREEKLALLDAGSKAAEAAKENALAVQWKGEASALTAAGGIH